MTLTDAWFISVIASIAFVGIGGTLWLAAEKWLWLKSLIDRALWLQATFCALFVIAIINVMAVPVLGLIVGTLQAVLDVLIFILSILRWLVSW